MGFRHRRISITGIYLLTCLSHVPVPPVHAAEAPAKLRWNFKAGQTLRYAYRQSTSLKLEGSGPSSKLDLQFDLTWKVQSVAEDGMAAVEQRIERTRVALESGTYSVKFDSRDEKHDPASAPFAQVYAAVVGRPYQLKMDTSGRLVEASIPKEVTDALKTSPFQAMADSGSVFSERGLKTMLAQVSPPLPKQDVATGNSWETTVDIIAPPLSLALKMDFKAGAIDARAAELDASLTLTPRPAPEAKAEATVGEQAGSLKVVFDLEAGRLKESKLEQSMTLTIVFDGKKSQQSTKIESGLSLVP